MARHLTPRRIMVIDDNRDAADVVAEFLQISGHNAVSTYDGKSALQIAEDFQPDVIFCDLGMPGMDGYTVAKRLRGMFTLARTKLVALTAWGDNDARAKVVASGFDYHLVKPASFDDILGQLT